MEYKSETMLPRYIQMRRKEIIEFCLNNNCYSCKCNKKCSGNYTNCERTKREYLNALMPLNTK